jgi:phosphatidylinositol alpha-1,6-mannosyltransferase
MRAVVLYLSPGVFDKGGVSRYCRYQVTALRELLGPDAVSVLSLLPPDGRGFEVPFEASFASFGGSLGGKAFFAAASVWAAAATRPTVVWCGHVHLAPLGLAVARMTGARLALNVYGAEVWTSLGPSRRLALRSADHVLSDCHATLDYIFEQGLRSRSGTSVHWDCVDVQRFRPGRADGVLQRYGVPDARATTMTLLTLARLTKEEQHKGVDRLIQVVAELRDQPVRLVVAGGGNWVETLRGMALDLGVGDKVYFTGRIDEADLVDVYRSCDIFSLITTKGPGTGEGLPLTPIEAAACGKPILVGNQDGSVEAVEDGVTGYVLEPTDIRGTADRILQLMREVDLRARLGRAGRARIEREMSYERFRGRLTDVLPSLGLGAR